MQPLLRPAASPATCPRCARGDREAVSTISVDRWETNEVWLPELSVVLPGSTCGWNTHTSQTLTHARNFVRGQQMRGSCRKCGENLGVGAPGTHERGWQLIQPARGGSRRGEPQSGGSPDGAGGPSGMCWASRLGGKGTQNQRFPLCSGSHTSLTLPGDGRVNRASR